MQHQLNEKNSPQKLLEFVRFSLIIYMCMYTLEERCARNLIWKARQALSLNDFLLSSSLPFD